MDIPHPDSTTAPPNASLSPYFSKATTTIILAVTLVLLSIMATIYLFKYMLSFFKIEKVDEEALPGRLWVSDLEADPGLGPVPGYYNMQRVPTLPRYEREGVFAPNPACGIKLPTKGFVMPKKAAQSAANGGGR
ncbi:hypothetical protein HDU98_001641 [Podochytrium sp. JEL0797]|nr:hypothetical protein HDU98_001641 [Podochytrium sp. JEL0797]